MTKMPQDYWQEIAAMLPMGEPRKVESLMAMFYAGCMASAVFLAEIGDMNPADRVESYRRWSEDIGVHGEGMMARWEKAIDERDRSGTE